MNYKRQVTSNEQRIMRTWTIQKLLVWITEYFTKKGIDPPRLSAELVLIAYNKTVHRLLSFPRKGLLPK